MRIAVVSDTHGSRAAIARCIEAAGDVDMWLHCGDFSSDAALFPNAVAVRGNCDGDADAPSERVIDAGGVRIFMCHGHRYGVREGLFRLALRAEELGCQAALFGHTHTSTVESSGGVLIMNPGSPFHPIGGKPSIGIITVENSDITSSRIIIV